MKKSILTILTVLLICCGAITACANDGFEYANQVGDPSYGNSSYPSPAYEEGYYLPLSRIMVTQTDNGPAFSNNKVLLVLGQSFVIKAYNGFNSNYVFVGDSNFDRILKSDGLFKKFCFSGDASATGLSEARILDNNGNIVATLGIEVINPYIVNKTNNGQTVSVPLYSWIILRLDANPTTGYNWQIMSQPSNLNIANSGYMKNPQYSQMAGAPAKEYFLIQATSPGTALLQLQYCRPWDTAEVAGSYSVQIAVSSQE